VTEVHGDIAARSVAPDNRVIVVNVGGLERRVQVHLETEHFVQVFLGRGRQGDALRQHLVVRQEQDGLLHLARDVLVFGIGRVERQAQYLALCGAVAEAQEERVLLDFDIQFLLALRDCFLQFLRQQLDELPGPPAPEAPQTAQQRIRITDAQGLQAALHADVHPSTPSRGGNSARGGSRQSTMVNGAFDVRDILTTASIAATVAALPDALA
jgi:hypothetical protein